MIWLLFACGHAPPEPPSEPYLMPQDAHSIAARSALARVPDPTRGGPAIPPNAAPLPPFMEVDRSTATYLGSQSCEGCHPDAYRSWQKSHHARAMSTLEESLQAHNPSCLQCHFTGFLHPGAPMERRLAEVGCESCHGPGSDHIANPTAAYGRLPSDGSACVACHTLDNSPDFRWSSYWLPIAHPNTPTLTD